MAGPTGGAAEIARAVEITAEVPQIEGTWRDWRRFPYWLVGIVGDPRLDRVSRHHAGALPARVGSDRARHHALTIEVTIWGFAIALVFGMILGLGRISRNVVIRNLAIFYIEFIRGVPILVLIFTIAYAVVPTVADALGFSATQCRLQVAGDHRPRAHLRAPTWPRCSEPASSRSRRARPRPDGRWA